VNIEGSTVFITGANRGVGLSFARAVLARGAAKVYAGMRNTTGFDETGVIPIQIDVTDLSSVKRAAAACQDVTLIINNAGSLVGVENSLDASVESVSRDLFEANYYGVVRVSQVFAPILIRNGNAGVINVHSILSWLPVPFFTAYAATKAAVWSYTNHLRLVLREHNIQVLGLHVGFMDTDMVKAIDAIKADPAEVVRQTLDALEAGKSEVMADTGTRAVKLSLSNEMPAYLAPAQLA
jgi:NAD(P)-dependent dehydrogenase (short-subunit alcohol dehydrogenase family)